MNKKILLIACFGLFLKSYGQQDPQYTQFMFNKQLYNPAVTGFDGKHCIALLARTQYAQYEDQTHTLNDRVLNDKTIFESRGSKTVTFSYGAPIPFAGLPKGKNSGGVGLSVYSDQAGYLTTNYFKADLAYKRDLDFGKAIGFGVNIGGMQKLIDVNGLLFKDPRDPLIPTGISPSGINVNFGAGVWYSNPDLKGLTVGYALQNLAGKPFAFGTVTTLAPGWHQYINVAAEFPWIVTIRPSLMIKASQQNAGFANPDFNLGVLADISETLQAGLGIRSSFKTPLESFSVLLGYSVSPKMRIGYSFDLNTTQLRGNNNNTHEIILNYCFTLKFIEKQPIILVDPRHIDKDPNIE